MKKNFFYLILLGFTFFFFNSCSETAGPSSTGSLSADIDGQSWKGSSGSLKHNQIYSDVEITGTKIKDNGSLETILIIVPSTRVGEPQISAIFYTIKNKTTNNENLYTVYGNNVNAICTIASKNDKYIEGTFSCTATLFIENNRILTDADGIKNIKILNGKFKVVLIN